MVSSAVSMMTRHGTMPGMPFGQSRPVVAQAMYWQCICDLPISGVPGQELEPAAGQMARPDPVHRPRLHCGEIGGDVLLVLRALVRDFAARASSSFLFAASSSQS